MAYCCISLFMWGMIFERIWYFSHGHSVYVKGLAEKWNSRKTKPLGMLYK